MKEAGTFSNPNEELEYLRARVLEAERGLGAEREREGVIRDSIERFKTEANIGVPIAHQVAAEREAETLLEKHGEVALEHVMQVAEAKGVLHALRTVEKMKGWRFEDDFHAYLAGLVSEGLPVRGMKEKGPIYQALGMKLFEVILPRSKDEGERPLAELVKSMEQLYAGLLTLEGDKRDKVNHLAFEIANPEGEEETRIFVSVPTSRSEFFGRQLLSVFPKARLEERKTDYNIFNEFGISIAATATLANSAAYPLKTFEAFGEDPLSVILNGFSKIPKTGAGAALQIIFKPVGNRYTKRYQEAIKEIGKGKKAKEALKHTSIAGEALATISASFFGSKKKDTDKPSVIDNEAITEITKKLESPIIETNIRLAVSAEREDIATGLAHNFEAAFNQLESPGKQSVKWRRVKSQGLMLKDGEFYRSFIFRLFRDDEIVPLNLKELSTILHFHIEALAESAPLVRSNERSAPPPANLKSDGTLIGINNFQGQEKPVHISKEDRLRHFYVIGQTGTGKSTLLKNMIIDDIEKGEGICMIDPHGSDVLEVLSRIPENRRDDVIYFDPASTERPMALNMLEYDPRYPEQKTFVVNELFSIFQKLYGAVPESMGPMFEQYFRNATMLVIEDPETGSTLLDVSRVMSNKEYRDLKLSHCKNPVVVQFWREVAEKAGGEAALANMVPYITSKFDVFLANDIMRPIIAQENSSFNFREIMDGKKILLVNLSKGRLGDINANLIGLILVGKILMAALSRVDSLSSDLAPFYLYIDEFQNITTDSISTILSEARKYKLSLTVAHQFIAQLEDRIRDSVFGNVGSMCAFRVGQDDAAYLEKQFAPVFTASDLANVDNFNAYVKLLINGRPAEPFNIKLIPPSKQASSDPEALKELSSLRYGKNRSEIESAIMEKYKK